MYDAFNKIIENLSIDVFDIFGRLIGYVLLNLNF